jgi:predicted nuclease of predicted toxin-antitoxin system
MRFLVDECTRPTVARWLRDQGHDVFSVFDEARGAEDRIFITNDKDYQREGLP